jgi:hypothetical protein
MHVQDAIRYAESLLPGEPAPGGEMDARWQAILEIGDLVETEPEAIWPFVSRWGRHPQEDLRMAIATCLLEHLLEHHFDQLFPRVQELAKADALFADTFCRCWKLGQAERLENAWRFDELRAACEPRRTP